MNFFPAFLYALLAAIILSGQERIEESKLHESLRTIRPNERIRVVIWGRQQVESADIHREFAWRKELVERLDDELRKRRSRLDVAVARPEEVEAARDREVVKYRRALTERVTKELAPMRMSLGQVLGSLGVKRWREFPLMNAMVTEVDGGQLNALAQSDLVLRIFPDHELKGLMSNSSHVTGASRFWEAGFAGEGESLAIIDSGIDPNHPVFAGIEVDVRVFGRYAASLENPCFADSFSDGIDRNGHGTHVASIAGGRPYLWNETWFLGVAPRVRRIYSLKALFRTSADAQPGCEDGSLGLPLDWAEALSWLITETPARVVNMSLGSLPPNGIVDNSVEDRIIDGFTSLFPDVSVVVAAGNSGKSGLRTVATPGNAFNAISVANWDHYNEVIADSSSKGPTDTGRRKPDIAAPGTGIWAARMGSQDLVALSGTSMAAPHVAGAVALLRQAGLVEPLQIKALLLNSSDGSFWQPDRGWGVVNVGSAYSVRDFVRSAEFVGRIGAERIHLYRWKPGESKWATITWNRELSQENWSLDALGLRAFSASTGQLDRQSVTPGQNVQQIQATGADLVLQVEAATNRYQTRGGNLRYGLAYSGGTLEAATGPMLSVNCSAAAGMILVGSTVRLQCRLRNSGDIAAVNPQLQVFNSTGTQVASGTSTSIPAGSESELTVSLLAPSAGTVRYSIRALSNSYGKIWETLGSASLNVSTASVPFRVQALYTAGAVMPGCTPPIRTNSFLTTTARVFAWANVEGVAANDLAIVDFISPSGQVYASLTQPRMTAQTSTCFSQEMQVAGSVAASLPGTWTVRLRWNNAIVGTTTFTLQAPSVTPFRVRELMVALQVPANCSTTPIAVTFVPSSFQQIHGWFSIDGGQTGDVATVDFVSPDGLVYSSQPMERLPSGGSWCGSRPLSIAQTNAVNRPGQWQLRLRWNGVVVATRNFEVSRLRVAQAITSLSLPGSLQGCQAPLQNLDFSIGAAGVGLFLSIDGLSAGDLVATSWISPSGTVQRSFQFQPLTNGGSWCFTDWMNIVGTSAANQTGNWSALILVNGNPVAAAAFQIR